MNRLTDEALIHIKNKILKTRDNVEVTKRKRRYTSKLDPFRYEILKLHNERSCSLGIIQRWLEQEKSLKASRKTILNRINHWQGIERE